MEKDKIKEGLRALYPKVGEELIEAAATYPGNSMAEIFIQRIIARAATYGLAKKEIGDVCPWGHEINQMFPGMLKHMRPDKKGEARGPIAQFRGKAFDRIEAITFEEWRKKKRGEELDEIESWVDSFFAKPKRDLGIERMLVDEAGPFFQDYLAGFNHESFEQEKIAHLMMGMDDPRLSGQERNIWIVSKHEGELKVWEGRYSECMGVIYTEGPHRNGDWIGWMEKEDYERPKGEGDGR